MRPTDFGFTVRPHVQLFITPPHELAKPQERGKAGHATCAHLADELRLAESVPAEARRFHILATEEGVDLCDDVCMGGYVHASYV